MLCHNAKLQHLFNGFRFASLVLILLSLLSPSPHLWANESPLWLVSHISNAETINPQQARAIFSLRQASWQNGSPIQVVIAKPSGKLHQQFCLDVLKLFPYQLQRIWDRQIYTGDALTPVEIDNHQQLLDYISTHPEAIGYTDQEISNENIRLLNML